MATDPSPFDAKAFLKSLTSLPGVYRLLDGGGRVLYVGKARNLKRRVSSYFRGNPTSAKVRSLVAHVQAIEITVTHTEAEALILESNLVKEFRPRYNVLLRDDKGYPYIHLSKEDFPRLVLHRGAKHEPGRYFGPYPHANAVRETLTLLQRIFRLRQCDNSFFSNRGRPCLQYQIKRCSAPCTGLISQADYQEAVQHAVLFLDGKSGEVIDDLVRRMETAAARLDFEKAAEYRDQIVQLRQIQERQYVSGSGGDVDVVACALRGGMACVQVFFIRDGRLLGNKNFFPQIPEHEESAQVLDAFLAQYYLDKPVPETILVSPEPVDAEWLARALQERAGHRVTIVSKVRGERARWLEMTQRNAEHALAAQLASQLGIQRRFEALQEALQLDFVPSRLECFDISHTQGEATVASCVVFTPEGPQKTHYRRYNIEGVAAGDDYGALHQALSRRYQRLREDEGLLPDLLFIDGGKGQVAQARTVLEELQVAGVLTVGIAKGPDRKAGLEMLYLSGSDSPLILPSNSAALHLLQQLRDEAHRFAIVGHRRRRAKARNTSTLEGIPGVGRKRRQALLKQFGGLQQLSRAGVEDIARVESVSKELAQRIYAFFHGEN
jgi:excinuclease ABC subunit C